MRCEWCRGLHEETAIEICRRCAPRFYAVEDVIDAALTWRCAAHTKGEQFAALVQAIDHLAAVERETQGSAEHWRVKPLLMENRQTGMLGTTYVAMRCFADGDGVCRLTPGIGPGRATREEADEDGRKSGLREWRQS